jgi:hypothetical protein
MPLCGLLWTKQRIPWVCFIANLVAGKLDIEVSSNPHLICSRVLCHTNHSTVARFVNDGLRVLWSNRVHEEKVLILYSDVAAYVLKATTALKVFYTNLTHFTSLAHGLQHVADEVRAKFPQMNKSISMTEKVFLKATH